MTIEFCLGLIANVFLFFPKNQCGFLFFISEKITVTLPCLKLNTTCFIDLQHY
jgi:hypothetical protein